MRGASLDRQRTGPYRVLTDDERRHLAAAGRDVGQPGRAQARQIARPSGRGTGRARGRRACRASSRGPAASNCGKTSRRTGIRSWTHPRAGRIAQRALQRRRPSRPPTLPSRASRRCRRTRRSASGRADPGRGARPRAAAHGAATVGLDVGDQPRPRHVRLHDRALAGATTATRTPDRSAPRRTPSCAAACSGSVLATQTARCS